jgi:diguanylate cyclase (GGDEF)-like protein
MSNRTEHATEIADKPSAGKLVFRIATAFTLLFAGTILWLVLDQHALLGTMETLQSKTLPSSIEQQRLARNMEVLRLEGERVLAARTPESQRQSLFIVTLMASHPSLLSNEHARHLAIETEQFLARAVQNGRIDESERVDWSRLSQRLSFAADDISVDGVNLAQTDIRNMGAIVQQTRHKLIGAMVLVLIFLVCLLLLIRQLILRPLQQIDQALADLKQPMLSVNLPAYALRELEGVRQAIVQLHDMMQAHEQTRSDLEKLASTDVLTGLHNRRHFMLMASTEIARAQRYGRPIAVALADLDHFKEINDVYGHAAGDLALRAFADLVQDTLRHSDAAGRYGGEEFSFVFPETTPHEAAILADRLRARLNGLSIPVDTGRQVSITVSFGIADASTHTLEEALRLADDALYQAKRNGRNAVVLSSTVAQSSLPLH